MFRFLQLAIYGTVYGKKRQITHSCLLALWVKQSMKYTSPIPDHPKGLNLLPTELITHWFSCPCSLSISRKTEKNPLCDSVCGRWNKLWSWDHTGKMITRWPGKLCSLSIFDRLIPTSPEFSWLEGMQPSPRSTS